MNATFLDTVGLIAVWDQRDQWHASASDIYSFLLNNRTRFYTTSYVLLECANAAARRPYRTYVDAMRDTFARMGGLIFPSDEDWQSAWDEYRNGQPGSPGVVDLISFRVMRKLGIVNAFTNDKLFRDAGFNPLF